MMLIQLFLVAICVFLIRTFLRRTLKLGVQPVLPRSLPFVGHLHLIAGDSKDGLAKIKALSEACNKQGGVTTVLIGTYRVYAITDPDDIVTAANNCMEKNFIYNIAKPWLGNGLITAPYAKWKQNRKQLSPAFSPQLLNNFMVVFNDQSRRLINQLAPNADKGNFDHEPFLLYNNLETICKTSFGINPDEHKDTFNVYLHNVKEILSIFFERFQQIWTLSDFLYNWTTLKKKQDAAINILKNTTYKILQQRKTEMKAQSYDKNDENYKGKCKPFLDLLLDLAINKGQFTEAEVMEQVDTMVVGGHDTTATILTYLLILVGSYSDVQEKIFRELQEVFEESNRDVLKDDLSKLVYLDAVIKESLRLYSLTPIIGRSVDEDVQLKNLTMVAGSSCALLIYGLHRHPMWGPDAEEFNPDRWLDPARLPSNLKAYAPFGVGRRACIGKIYAMMSLKTTLAHLLRRYHVTADVTKLELKLDVMLKPASGHQIAIVERA